MSYLRNSKRSTAAVTNVAAEVQQVNLIGNSSEVSVMCRAFDEGLSAGSQMNATKISTDCRYDFAGTGLQLS